MNRRSGIIAATVLTCYIFCGAATSTQGCQNEQIGPSEGEIIAAGVAIVVGVAIVTTVVLVEVNNAHHTIQGCVTSGPAGIQVENERDKKMYTVTGVTQDVKVGDRVKVHGNKEKNQKGSTADQVFVVQKLNKNYGACPVTSPVDTVGVTAQTQ